MSFSEIQKDSKASTVEETENWPFSFFPEVTLNESTKPLSRDDSTLQTSKTLPKFLVDCPNILKGHFNNADRSFSNEHKETLKLMIENEQISLWLDERYQLKRKKT